MQEEIIDEVEVDMKKESTHTVTFSDVLARLWVFKYTLFIFIAVGIGLGIVIGSGLPKTYNSSLTMVPESTKTSSGTSAALAALGMANGIASEDAYNPSIYPEIVSSIPFVVGLLDVEVQTSVSDSTYKLRDYLAFHTTSAWWNTAFKKEEKEEEEGINDVIDPFHLTKGENNLYQTLSHSISTSVDKVTAQITISVTLQDPLVAALLVDTVAARLQEYITDYRTAKARNDLDYAIEIYEEAQQQYYEAQQTYAEYMDRNQGLAQYTAQTTRDRLENDMKLAFNLYNQTSQNMQQCQAKVQEQTPVFAIVSPATVPIKPTGPRKLLILLISTFLFTLVGAIIICFPLFFSNSFREKIQHQSEKERLKRRNRWSFLRKKSNKEEEEEGWNEINQEEYTEQETPPQSSPDSYSIEEENNQS